MFLVDGIFSLLRLGGVRTFRKTCGCVSVQRHRGRWAAFVCARNREKYRTFGPTRNYDKRRFSLVSQTFKRSFSLFVLRLERKRYEKKTTILVSMTVRRTILTIISFFFFFHSWSNPRQYKHTYDTRRFVSPHFYASRISNGPLKYAPQ